MSRTVGLNNFLRKTLKCHRKLGCEIWSFMREISGTLCKDRDVHVAIVGILSIKSVPRSLVSQTFPSSSWAEIHKSLLDRYSSTVLCWHNIENSMALPLSQPTPAHIEVNRKSHFLGSSYPEEWIFMATLIGRSATTHFWVAKIGANQVGKVLLPASTE